MSAINKVALIGKGFLGSAILNQMLEAGFDVTVLSRSGQEVPTGAAAVQVDYSSIESLSEAMRGHDVVVSTITTQATLAQKAMIDAAICAGVKRFIPSDFGSLNNDPKAKDVAFFQAFIQIQNYLKEKSEAGEIDYTLFSTGPFLEYVFGSQLFVDFHNRTAQLHGKGDARVSATSIAGIGKAVVGALQNSNQTKNRLIHVHETVVTQVEILELAKKASPKGSEWTETTVDPLTSLRIATDKIAKNPTDFFSVIGVLKAALLSGQYDTEYIDVDNELVGLPLLSDEDLEKNFARFFSKKL